MISQLVNRLLVLALLLPIVSFTVLFIATTMVTNNNDNDTASTEPTVCPNPDEIQSWYVQNFYSEHNHVGLYYELAYKDVTQPRICKCITSNKTLSSKDNNNNNRVLNDDFGIQCHGRVYHSNLSFDLFDENDTNNYRRGYMIGKWNNFLPMKGVTFPNWIVDVGVNPSTGTYDWVIEFQCKQGWKLFDSSKDWIQYYGINFYSREYNYDNDGENERLQVMIDAARRHGLGPFLDSGLDLFVVDHTNCIEDH